MTRDVRADAMGIEGHPRKSERNTFVGSADPSLNAIASIIFVLSGLVLFGVELLLIPLLMRRPRPTDAAA